MLIFAKGSAQPVSWFTTATRSVMLALSKVSTKKGASEEIMVTPHLSIGYHEKRLVSHLKPISLGHSDIQFTYTFENFFHPFVGELVKKLNTDSLQGMLDAGWQDTLKTPDPKTDPAHDFFHQLYSPQNSNLAQVESSPKEIDVSGSGPYANYNWELFFYIPLTIAVHLSKTQRFAEAQRWFHYIFDPTSNDQRVELTMRPWRFLAFRHPDDNRRIEEIVHILSIPRSELPHNEQLLQDEILFGYDAIRNKPFQPHAVARTRHLAYQYCVVMKY